MVVSELIEELRAYPSDMIVMKYDGYWGSFEYFDLEVRQSDRIFGPEDIPIKRNILVIV